MYTVQGRVNTARCRTYLHIAEASGQLGHLAHKAERVFLLFGQRSHELGSRVQPFYPPVHGLIWGEGQCISGKGACDMIQREKNDVTRHYRSEESRDLLSPVLAISEGPSCNISLPFFANPPTSNTGPPGLPLHSERMGTLRPSPGASKT